MQYTVIEYEQKSCSGSKKKYILIGVSNKTLFTLQKGRNYNLFKDF